MAVYRADNIFHLRLHTLAAPPEKHKEIKGYTDISFFHNRSIINL
jgi:hypothetical protein